MTMEDLRPLTPLILLSLTSVAGLLAITIRRNHAITAIVTCMGFAMTAWCMPSLPGDSTVVAPLLVMDGFAQFFIALFSLSSLAVALLAYRYLNVRREHREEFYVLLAISTLGAAVLVSSRHFALFFLGLETMSIALYGLVGYFRTRSSIEAGIKYLILAGAASGLLLFGIALVYAETGALAFDEIQASLATGTGPSLVLLAGMALIIAGSCFELALVPFHLWTADVYRGAAAPVTAFIATVGKGALLAAVLRLFLAVNGAQYPTIITILATLAIASMFVGNLLGVLERNVKRILAYSSIAHLGYLIVALIAHSSLGSEAISYYLAAYFATTLAAFGIISSLSSDTAEPEDIEDWRGLYWRRPGMAVLMTLCMLSLAGVPLTAGFVGKFYLLAAGVHAGLWFLVACLVLSSVIGLFYYLRIVVSMLKPLEDAVPSLPTPTIKTHAVLAVLGLVILALGLMPAILQPRVVQSSSVLVSAPLNVAR